MKRRVYAAFGGNVYPSPTAAHGERLGRTPFRKCRQCGHPNDTRSTAWTAGTADGNGGLSVISGSDPTEWEVLSGCAFCGSTNWIPGPPRKLPDDRNFPARRYKRRRR